MLFLLGIIIIFLGILKLNYTYASNHNSESDVELAGIVPFYWLIMLIGGIILIALSYVGWRKYKGHKSKQKRDANN